MQKNYNLDVDYSERPKEEERKAAETFNKEKTLSLIHQRLEEMRHESEFNRECIELLKTKELLINFDLLSEFTNVLYQDPSFRFFEDMSSIANEPVWRVLMMLSSKLK